MFATAPPPSPFLSDYVHDHHSDVHVVKSCRHERGRGLLAVAGESRVEVLLRVSLVFQLTWILILIIILLFLNRIHPRGFCRSRQSRRFMLVQRLLR